MFERLFHLSENGSNVYREVAGGCTTFLTMSYIIFLQPVILSACGMDFNSVMVATCIASSVSTFLMGFYANYPIALAPGVGLNVFFAIIVCQGMGVPWQTALGAVFVSGAVFALLSFVGFRKMVMEIIPNSIKLSIAVGIGLMIALLGFQWAGVVVDNPSTLISVGKLTKPYIWVSGLGLIVSMILTCWNVRGAILVGIITSGVTAYLYGIVEFKGIFSTPPSIEPTLFALNLPAVFDWRMLSVIFVFLIVDMFDTVGTLVGVSELGGFMREGKLPRANRALFSDAAGTMFGSLLGTSTVTSYVESSSGISDGARTGLANVVTGMLFLAALFFSPLVQMLGQGIEIGPNRYVYPVIAPALIMVGYMMMRAIRLIDWEKPSDALPAFLTIVMIPFSFSITEGIAFGFMSYTILKISTGNLRDVHPVLLILSILFAIRYFWLPLAYPEMAM